MIQKPMYDFVGRLARAREKMKAHGLDAFYVNAGPNMQYFAGWSAYPGGWPIWLSALIIPAAGEPTFIMSKMHNDILQCSDSWLKGGDVRTHMDGDNLIGELAGVLKEKGLRGGRVGVEDNMWYAEYDFLRQVDATIRVERAGHILDSLRQVKDAGEIEAIRRATEITTIGHQCAAEVIREGVAEYEAAMEIVKAMLGAGAEEMSCGLHGSFLKTLPRKFEKGDVIDVDMGARWDGYGTDYARNVFVGKPSKEVERAQKLTAETFYRTFEMVKPGIEAQQVHRFAIDYMKKRAIWDGCWPTWKIGHGVGLAQGHEAPLIQEGETLILEPGMVFVIDPGCFISGQFRDTPIHIENAVVVTETGCENLATYTMDMVVV